MRRNVKWFNGTVFFILLNVSFLLAQNSIVNQFSQALADVAEKANPAVVTIMTEKVYTMNEMHKGLPFDPFRFFPRNMPDREYYGHALGSGVIVDEENGYVLTNNHVIDDADEIQVQLIDKRVVVAEIVGTDPKSDLAVLQIENEDLSALELGDSDDLRVGEWVLAIGSPFSANLSHTVTTGIVSALGRSNIISGNHYEDFIQTDAAINPGNSGGALLNMDGKLVGINTAIATGGGFERSNRGVGFAIPSNMAKKVMHDLITKGYVVRSWLGVYIQEVNHNVAKALDLETIDGALVSNVVEDSPADKGGLKEGDVIIMFDGAPVSDPSHLKNIVSSTPPGKRATVELIRDGHKKSIKVTLEELDEDSQPLAAHEGTSDSNFGLHVRNLSPKLAEQFDIDRDESGVVVTDVATNSIAHRAGIRPGDLITRIGTESVENREDFEELMDKMVKKGTLLLLVKRENVSRFYALDFED